jgi:hypothetical protein
MFFPLSFEVPPTASTVAVVMGTATLVKRLSSAAGVTWSLS